MSANQQMEVRGGQSLVPGDFKLKFGTIGPNGYEYTPGLEITEHQMLEEADRLAGGFAYIDFIGSKREVIIGTFVRNSEVKFGEAASQVYAKFGMKEARLKNVLQVIDHVPIELVNNPNISFEAAYEVVHIKDKDGKTDVKAQEDLLTLAAENKLTVAELKVAKKAYLAERAAPTDPADDKAPAPTPKVAPFYFTFTFEPPEPKEALKTYEARVTKAIMDPVKEAIKRYMQPKYAAAQAAKERETKFKALMTDVPKDDQAQFVKMYEENIPVTAIDRAVKKYQATKADADALDTLLNTVVDEVKRAEFQLQAVSGTPFKTVESNVKTWNKRAVNVKTVEKALDEAKITNEAARQSFISQLDGTPTVGDTAAVAPAKVGAIVSAIKKEGKKVSSVETDRKAINEALDAAKITEPEAREKFLARLGKDKVGAIKADVKKAGRDAETETKRAADVKALLETVPEDQREKFLETADVSLAAKDFKAKVTAWNSAKASENKDVADQRRKAVKDKRANAATMLKTVNTKRETAVKFRTSDQEALAVQEESQADEIEAAANKMIDECDQEIVEINLMLGLPAHPKPTKGEGKKPGKKKLKKQAHKGSKR